MEWNGRDVERDWNFDSDVSHDGGVIGLAGGLEQNCVGGTSGSGRAVGMGR